MARVLPWLGLLVLGALVAWLWQGRDPAPGEVMAPDPDAPLPYEAWEAGAARKSDAPVHGPVLEAGRMAAARTGPGVVGTAPGSSEPTGPYALTVIRWETEMPLEGVAILTETAGEPVELGTTDEDGAWEIVDAGTPHLVYRAVKEGYLEHHGVLQPGARPEVVLHAGVPIAGVVLRADTRAPVPLASVRVWDVDLAVEIASTASDEEGRFRLRAVRPHHPVVLVVAAPDLVPQVLVETFEGAREDHEIVIGAGGRIHGRVLGTGGAPLADVEVRLLREGEVLFEQRPDLVRGAPQGPRRGMVEIARARTASVRTDEQGRYGFTGIPPGVTVQPVAVITPRLLARGPTTRFELREAEREIDLQVPSAATLRIRVEGGPGVPLGHAQLQILLDGAVVPPSSADHMSEGAFVLQGLGAGRVVVTATVPGRPVAGGSGKLRPGETTELTIEMPPGGELLGEVQDKRGRPIWKASVSWRGNAPRESVSARTDVEGRFRLHGLQAEEGTLIVAARDLPHTRMAYEPAKLDAVRPEEGRQFITLKDGTQIRGRFRDLPPSAVVTCELLGGLPQDAGRLTLDERRGFTWRGPEANTRGATFVFRTHGLPPLVVGEEAPFQSEEVRDVGILAFEAANPRRGRVVDDAGGPVHAAKVTLDVAWSDRSTRTDTEGRFGFARVPDEELRLRIDAPGFPPYVATLSTRSQYTPQVIRIQAGRWVTIQVKDGRRETGGVQVWIRDATGRPADSPRAVSVGQALVTDAKGHLRVELPYGTYHLQAQDPRSGRQAKLRIEVQPKGDGVIPVELAQGRWGR